VRKRWARAWRRASHPAQLLVVFCLLAVLALAVNWIYQVARKPTELFFPVSGTLYKTPAETWRSYGSAFRAHSTPIMTPPFLAALAQVEGSGNPLVRTYWRWSWRAAPLELYRPASSAVGMYQITDGTFAEARRFCIHDHAVAADGPWNDWDSCWFNALYFRVIPSHAIELTSAYLDRAVSATLARHHLGAADLRRRQQLAAYIHLCGAGAGDAFAQRGLKFLPGERCGDHEARAYVGRVEAMRSVFAKLSEDVDAR